jgi:hypothetical protein
MKTEQVKGKNSKNEDVVYNVKKPTSLDYRDAKLYSNGIAAKIASTVDKDGKPAFLTRAKIRNLLVQTGEWNNALEQELMDSYKEINDAERKLAKGGIKKSDAKTLALRVRAIRNRQAEILSKTRSMDEYSIEAQVDNANFDYLVFICILDEEGKRVYKDIDDYKENGNDEVTIKAASKLAEMLYGYDENAEKELPENRFLLKYGFVNDKLQLIDKDNNLIDELGRRIDNDGRLLNGEGKFIDIDGNLLDADGNPIEEFQEFLED